jgi:hypothetical protein
MAQCEKANHGICYCNDCQAYAHFLEKEEDILDSAGGTEVVTTLQSNITFTHGKEQLACMSLSERGALRWYARCCNTPIGNTVRNFKVSFIGVVHTCLKGEQKPIDSVFGPVRMRVNIKGAKERVEPMSFSTLTSALPFLGSLISACVSGSYKQSPFFDPHSGEPVISPKVHNKLSE